jgi:hypothetical protein
LSQGVAEVFREAGRVHIARGEKRLAVFLEKLPTKEDQTRFFEAARAFLSFDWKIRNLPAGRRRALLRATIENVDQEKNILTELWRASYRVLHEVRPGAGASELDVQLFVTRVLMARLIVGGIQGAADKIALLDAALLLRELSDRAQETRSKSEGKNARREALTDDSAQHAQRVAHLKTEAAKLRQDRPHLRSQRERAAKLNRRFQKQGLRYWPTSGALIEFARRNRHSCDYCRHRYPGARKRRSRQAAATFPEVKSEAPERGSSEACQTRMPASPCRR